MLRMSPTVRQAIERHLATVRSYYATSLELQVREQAVLHERAERMAEYRTEIAELEEALAAAGNIEDAT